MWWIRVKPHPAARLPIYSRKVLQTLLDAPVVIPVTLLALAVCTLGALVRPRIDVAFVLALLAAIWTRVNQPVEGAILHSWTSDHGFTEADLVSVAALLVAGVTVARCGWRWLSRALHPQPGRVATR
jgi:biotin transporter BioY